MSDVVKFTGRFHPVVLHLPIGFLTLVALLESMNFIPFLKKKFETTFILFLGAASSVVAILLGFALYKEKDMSGAMIDDHLWGGIYFGCVVIAALLLKMWAVHKRFLKMLGSLAVFAACAVMGSSAHSGALSVHGKNYLTQYAPKWLPDPLYMALGDGTPRKEEDSTIVKQLPSEGPIMASVITPIFEQKCLYCHSEAESVKGKFRMETVDLMAAGGRSGDPGIVPGDAKASLIMQRIHLPLDDEDEEHMPPPEKDQLEEHEIALLEWWINQGAPEDETVSIVSLGAPSEIVIAANQILSEADRKRFEDEERKRLAEKAAADKARRAELEAGMASIKESYPGALNFVSRQSTDLTFTAVSMRSKFTDTDLAKLSPVASGITSLDLAASSVTDEAVINIITDMKLLEHLKLNETAVTDEAIDTIKTLEHLKSLNLYGTQVTDDGIMALKDLKYLKKVYLWNSQVTPKGAKALQEALSQSQAELIKAKTEKYEAASDKDREKEKLRPGKQPEVLLGS